MPVPSSAALLLSASKNIKAPAKHQLQQEAVNTVIDMLFSGDPQSCLNIRLCQEAATDVGYTVGSLMVPYYNYNQI